jgi:DNA ligase-1
LPDAEFILDCEVVAWDKEQQHILPFQILSTRKRKDVTSAEVKVQVCLFAFDLLYLNGQSLLREPLLERRRRLHTCFTPVQGQFEFATFLDTTQVEAIHDFLEQAVKSKRWLLRIACVSWACHLVVTRAGRFPSVVDLWHSMA